MPRVVWHYEEDIQGSVRHYYYSSLTAFYNDQEGSFPVSKFTLDRWNWENDYRVDDGINGKLILRKGNMYSNNDLKNIIQKH